MQEEKTSRRAVLKSAGIATTGLSAISGLGSAKSEDHSDPYEQSLFLREKHNWSVHEWRKYLLKRGMNLKVSSETIDLPRGRENQDSPSDQALTRDKFTLYMTYLERSVYDYDRFNVDWEFKVCDGRWAESPHDVVEIKWEGAEYDRQKTPDYGKYASDISGEDSKGLNGCVCKYDDASHSIDHYYDDGDCYSFSSYFGTPLSRGDGTACDRQIDVNYYHTWSDPDYNISWTYGVPSVSFSDSGDRWVAEATTRECDMDDGAKKYTYNESGKW